MTKKVDSLTFANTAESIRNRYLVQYKNGKSGEKNSDGAWQCDCRGYIIWTLRNLGISISSSGTNWMIRNQMTSVEPIKMVSQLEPGMVVFKYYEKGNSKWNLPAKYRNGGFAYNARFGQIDVYHVGIIVQVKPSLIIRHCTGGGIKTDTAIGAWRYVGWVNWVQKDFVETPIIPNPGKVTNNMIGTVIGSAKVNLRKAPNTKAARVEYMMPGDTVTILKDDCGTPNWYYVKYNQWSGYVMSKFIDA